MITTVTRREEERLSWTDIEMLPIYGAVLVLGGLILQSLPDLGPAVHSALVKAALIVGLVGVQHWLATNDHAID